MTTTTHARRHRTLRLLGTPLAMGLATVLAGCDTKVTNPGPVLDEYVSDAAAHNALLQGAGRAYALALTYYGMTGGAIAKELIGSGNITNHGLTVRHDAGRLVPGEDVEADAHWNNANRARWTAEEAVRRMRGVADFATYETGTRALIWAGYSNRMLGENSCAAVIDGGVVQDRMIYFDRAVEAFSEAADNATAMGNDELRYQALAGRAAAKAWLGDWSGVATDAALVPGDFVFEAEYFATTTADDGEHNRLFWASEGSTWRNFTIWGTFFETYYTDTGDERTPWHLHPTYPRGTRGSPPPLFYVQGKYTGRDSPIHIATGREMAYLLAESELRAGSIGIAVDRINTLRADVGMAAVTAVTADEAWSLLKQERAVEFWMEGRRLGDIWRWEQDAAVLGVQPDEAALAGRDRCFPFSSQEINANPNVSGPYG